MPLVKNKHIKLYVKGSNKKLYVGDGFFDGLFLTLPLKKIKDFILRNGINFMLNNAPIPELHLIEGTKKYNFCGPFTNCNYNIYKIKNKS